MDAVNVHGSKHDPKKEKLDASLKSKIKAFFSAQADPSLIERVESGEIELKLNLDEIVQTNYRREQILKTLVEDGEKQDKPHFEEFIVGKATCEVLRKAKL